MRVELFTSRLFLRELSGVDAVSFYDFLLRNKEFFKPWSPAYDDNYDDIEYHKIMLERSQTESLDGRHYKFGVFLKGELNKIIGSVALSNIVMGNFRSCFLGYRLDKSENSRGYATEAIQRVVEFGLNELGLHRIEANIMPQNKPSLKVIQKLGFTYEGTSKKYLKINGVWEDHMHYVILNEDDKK